MKAAIYARVSTNNGQDPEMQLREIREYCERRGWEITDKYWDDIMVAVPTGVASSGISIPVDDVAHLC